MRLAINSPLIRQVVEAAKDGTPMPTLPQARKVSEQLVGQWEETPFQLFLPSTRYVPGLSGEAIPGSNMRPTTPSSPHQMLYELQHAGDRFTISTPNKKTPSFAIRVNSDRVPQIPDVRSEDLIKLYNGTRSYAAQLGQQYPDISSEQLMQEAQKRIDTAYNQLLNRFLAPIKMMESARPLPQGAQHPEWITHKQSWEA